ncbi:oleate hydratase [Massilia sp. DWR3-1-1]|uniref:oleate hydratase n=1 Tax=Massilia sp. DWR3-1-1 TaxID=2804559 RepID=UPI003CF42239
MHYSSGNYEAFVRPRPPAGAERKTAWFVGSGLAGLAGAAFLIRDGGVAGERITILEQQSIPGGALDGLEVPEKGFVIRGGREMEQHFECLWDLYRSIPSLEMADASVLDEFYRLDKDDPNFSLQRVTQLCGQDVADKALLTLNDRAQKELLSVFMASRDEMENKRINEVFGEDFLKSNFWLYWRTMFAFEEWHSALEMKLYLHRFIHHIGSLADFSSLKFNRYNQYESMVLPLVKWLTDRGVVFRYGVEVTDVGFDIGAGRKQATRIDWLEQGVAGGVDLGADDLVFVTIGSLTENSDDGDHHTAARLKEGPAPAWDLWRRIAAQDPAFGRPDVFGSHIPETKWESATVTTLDARIPRYIEAIAKRDPFSGKVVTAGIVTVKDSSWLLSWTVSRQPHFKQQPKDQVVGWLYALFVDRPGDFVKKPMQDCTGEEITQEWLYHLGVPVDQIVELAATGARTVPVMMPYITAFFMPRQAGDRPDIVPQDAVNFAFIGQFAETKERDCIFTTEYSVRTAMEAVYTLLDVERAVPEVFNSTYDIRALLAAITPLRDGRALDIPGPDFLRKLLLRKLEGTEISDLLKQFKLIGDEDAQR